MYCPKGGHSGYWLHVSPAGGHWGYWLSPEGEHWGYWLIPKGGHWRLVSCGQTLFHTKAKGLGHGHRAVCCPAPWSAYQSQCSIQWHDTWSMWLTGKFKISVSVWEWTWSVRSALSEKCLAAKIKTDVLRHAFLTAVSGCTVCFHRRAAHLL